MAKVIARRAFATDATKTTFSIGSASVGYARFTSLPTDCAAIEIGDSLSARISAFFQASSTSKQGQVRIWAGNAVFDEAGVVCGYEAWALGVALFTSDGLAITAAADTLYSRTGEPAKKLGGTVLFKAASSVAVGAPVSCPPGLLVPSEAAYGEGNNGYASSAGGAGAVMLPHLCRKSLLFLDPALLDSADAATNAATAINFVVENFRC